MPGKGKLCFAFSSSLRSALLGKMLPKVAWNWWRRLPWWVWSGLVKLKREKMVDSLVEPSSQQEVLSPIFFEVRHWMKCWFWLSFLIISMLTGEIVWQPLTSVMLESHVLVGVKHLRKYVSLVGKVLTLLMAFQSASVVLRDISGSKPFNCMDTSFRRKLTIVLSPLLLKCMMMWVLMNSELLSINSGLLSSISSPLMVSSSWVSSWIGSGSSSACCYWWHRPAFESALATVRKWMGGIGHM